MTRISRALSALVLALAPAALIFSAAPAHAVDLPPGSYLQTCNVVSINAEVMSAVCKKIKKGYTGVTKNFPYIYCSGGIGNDDGHLTCAWDATKKSAAAAAEAAKIAAENAAAAKWAAEQAAKNKAAAMAKNKAAFASASVIVLGRGTDAQELDKWLMTLEQPVYGMNSQLNEGLNFSDGVNFLKKYIATPGGGGLRAEAIDNAYFEVMGRASTPIEQAQWDAQIRNGQTWYSPMSMKLHGQVVGNATTRADVINRAYRTAMGRDAKPEDTTYWMAQDKHFMEIVAAARTWLYSPEGAGDLIETTRRALGAKGGAGRISDAAVKAAMTQYAGPRAIYAEMISPTGSMKVGK